MSTHKIFPVFLASLILLMHLEFDVQAFPPAPGMVVKGIVRDEYGWVLRDEGAEVVFRQGAIEIARAPIVNDINFGFNYTVQLPTDSGVTPEPYRPGALVVSSNYSVEIHVANAIYLPIETLSGALPIPESGSTVSLDLTLGTDSDGDGLPDDWELWQLQVAGLYPGDANYNLNQLGAPGNYDGDAFSDYQEYLTGTLASINFSHIKFDLVSARGPNPAEFDYYAVRDKAFQVESSDDGENWTVVPVSLDVPLAAGTSAWTAEVTGTKQLFIPKEGPRQFYRLRIR